MMKFVKSLIFNAKGGDGGSGSKKATFFGGKTPFFDGGNGGDGGNVILTPKANCSIYDLYINYNLKTIKAENGFKGNSRNCSGKKGSNKEIFAPLGTFIKKSSKDCGEISFSLKEQVIISTGGRGGRGSSITKNRKTSDGEAGEFNECVLEFIPSFEIVIYSEDFNDYFNMMFANKFKLNNLNFNLGEIYPVSTITELYTENVICYIPKLCEKTKCIVENNKSVLAVDYFR